MLKSLTLSVSMIVLAGAAGAECLTASSGAACETAKPTVDVVDRSARQYAAGPGAQLFHTGDTLPSGQFNVLLNTEYYGLPAVSGDWLYYRVDNRVVKVNRRTMEVLEDVTHLTNAAF